MAMSIKRARTRAREMSLNEKSLSYQQALDAVARENGFDIWSDFSKSENTSVQMDKTDDYRPKYPLRFSVIEAESGPLSHREIARSWDDFVPMTLFDQPTMWRDLNVTEDSLLSPLNVLGFLMGSMWVRSDCDSSLLPDIWMKNSSLSSIMEDLMAFFMSNAGKSSEGFKWTDKLHYYLIRIAEALKVRPLWIGTLSAASHLLVASDFMVLVQRVAEIEKYGWSRVSIKHASLPETKMAYALSMIDSCGLTLGGCDVLTEVLEDHDDITAALEAWARVLLKNRSLCELQSPMQESNLIRITGVKDMLPVLCEYRKRIILQKAA